MHLLNHTPQFSFFFWGYGEAEDSAEIDFDIVEPWTVRVATASFFFFQNEKLLNTYSDPVYAFVFGMPHHPVNLHRIDHRICHTDEVPRTMILKQIKSHSNQNGALGQSGFCTTRENSAAQTVSQLRTPRIAMIKVWFFKICYSQKCRAIPELNTSPFIPITDTPERIGPFTNSESIRI